VSDVFDVAIGLSQPGSLDVKRIVLEAVGELAHRGGEGRRDEVGAALVGHSFEDRLELLAKAHLEHAIRLVEDDVLDSIADERTGPQVVERPARRADDDLRSLRECAPLEAERGAAHHDLDGESANPLEEPAQLFANLHGELSRRHQNEHARARAVGTGSSRAVGQVMSQRQADRDRLARTRLR
jgi:hypothetical protein